jgi:hypothetical protein
VVDRQEVTTSALVSGTASLVGHFVPDLAIPSAALAPVASATLKAGWDRFRDRRRRRQEWVFSWAAETAGIDAQELNRRCEDDPYLEELLQLVMSAAADTADQKKLIAYALALRDGTVGSMPEHWQSALVRAIRDLAPEHLELLDRFTRTSNELLLGDGTPEFDRVPLQLSDGQVAMVSPDIAALPSALAVLQGHGLLVHLFVSGGSTLGMGGSSGYWQITEFGVEVLNLFKALGERLESSD